MKNHWTLIDSLSTSEALDLFGKGDKRIFHGLVDPGSFVFVPMASFSVERVLGTTNLCGIRTAVLSQCDRSVHDFSQLTEAFSTTEPNSTNTLVPFWDQVKIFLGATGSK